MEAGGLSLLIDRTVEDMLETVPREILRILEPLDVAHRIAGLLVLFILLFLLLQFTQRLTMKHRLNPLRTVMNHHIPPFYRG